MVWWGFLAIVWGMVSLRAAFGIVTCAHRFFDMPGPPEEGQETAGFPGAPAYLAAGLGFLAPVFLLDDPAGILLMLAVMTICLWTAVLDWQTKAIPDLFVVGLAVLAVVQAVLERISLWEPVVAASGSAALVAALLIGSAALRSGAWPPLDEIAWGDVTLIAGLGALVGVAGLPVFWFLIGPVHLAFHLATRRGREALRAGAPLPMAPALCVAGVLSLLASRAGFDWMEIFV